MDINRKFTVAGTDIEEVKRLNAQSGLSYKEVYELLAKTGGQNTNNVSANNKENSNKKLH